MRSGFNSQIQLYRYRGSERLQIFLVPGAGSEPNRLSSILGTQGTHPCQVTGFAEPVSGPALYAMPMAYGSSGQSRRSFLDPGPCVYPPTVDTYPYIHTRPQRAGPPCSALRASELRAASIRRRAWDPVLIPAWDIGLLAQMNACGAWLIVNKIYH